MYNTVKYKTTEQKSDSDIWFENYINTIKAHKLIYETKGVNSDNINELYDTMIHGTDSQILLFGQELMQQTLIKKMVADYIIELKERKIDYSNLYIDYNNSGLLTWFVINENDFETEKQIILAAAKVNVKYYDYEYSISNSIVEESDNIKVPKHYQTLK